MSCILFLMFITLCLFFLMICLFTLYFSGSSKSGVELPPELCIILLSPVSLSTVYSFSLIPSLIYRIQSILLVSNLNILSDNSMPENILPAMKVDLKKIYFFSFSSLVLDFNNFIFYKAT